MTRRERRPVPLNHIHGNAANIRQARNTISVKRAITASRRGSSGSLFGAVTVKSRKDRGAAFATPLLARALTTALHGRRSPMRVALVATSALDTRFLGRLHPQFGGELTRRNCHSQSTAPGRIA